MTQAKDTMPTKRKKQPRLSTIQQAMAIAHVGVGIAIGNHFLLQRTLRGE